MVKSKKIVLAMLNGFKAGCGKGMRFVWLASVLFIAAALMALLCNTFFPDLFGYSLYQLDSPPETVYDIDPSLIWSIVQVDGNTVWVYRIDFIQTYWPTFIMMMMSFILLAASAVQFVMPFFAGKGKFSRRRYWMAQVVLFILVLMCGSIHICMAIIAGVTNGMAKFWWYGIIPIILILAGIALECCGFGTLLKGYEYEDEGV